MTKRRSEDFMGVTQRGFTISAAQQWCSRAAAELRRPGFAGRRVRSEGFTIIEVLVVLAIAGLIMVVVFLAVPALQRNSRNSALNADARAVLAAVGNYRVNNGGSLPAAQTATAPTDGTVTIGASGSNQEIVRLGGGTATVQVDNGATPITTADPIGTIQAVTGSNAVCDSTATGLSGSGSNASYAVLYIAESANDRIRLCIN